MQLYCHSQKTTRVLDIKLFVSLQLEWFTYWFPCCSGEFIVHPSLRNDPDAAVEGAEWMKIDRKQIQENSEHILISFA